MKLQHIKNQFTSMGARLKPSVVAETAANQSALSMNIAKDRQGQFFTLSIPESMEVNVLQVRPRERHLLLLVKHSDSKRQNDRFLCGHDEREWFVAAVPGRVSTVADAMESLKPGQVQAAQAKAGLRPKQRQTRKNRAFLRQGEWFFIPAPSIKPDPKLILWNEPIRRGRGKPHLVEMLYREGGKLVYVCWKYPNGISEKAYRDRLKQKPSIAKWGWTRMQRDAKVYARGQIRHSDHRTITLQEWHEVLMNTETQSQTMRNVAFLD